MSWRCINMKEDIQNNLDILKEQVLESLEELKKEDHFLTRIKPQMKKEVVNAALKIKTAKGVGRADWAEIDEWFDEFLKKYFS